MSLPIRARLTLAFALVMTVVLTAMGSLVYLRVAKALVASVDQSLLSQAREASHHSREGGSLVDSDVAGGTTLAEIVDSRGVVTRSSPRGLPLLIPNTALESSRPTTRGSVTLRSPAGSWRYLAVRRGRSTVVVARSLEPRNESLRRLLRELLVAAPLALLLASLAGYGLAAAALRPVEAMRRRAAAVSARSPGRLPVSPARDEISRLATTLNEMLERLESAFEHERRFVADASHELRTPLAMLRAELELALRRPRSRGELHAALSSAAQETERLSQLAEDLLLIARADQGGLPIRPERVLLDDVFEAVARRYARRAEADGRTLRVRTTETALDLDPTRVEQALANLVENALAHGNGVVDLFAITRDDVVELHVADEGAGFPEPFLERAFERFSRAEESRTGAGSGLGLSIVAAITEAHGGEVGAANRDGGGADVWIALPRTRSVSSQPALI